MTAETSPLLSSRWLKFGIFLGVIVTVLSFFVALAVAVVWKFYWPTSVSFEHAAFQVHPLKISVQQLRWQSPQQSACYVDVEQLDAAHIRKFVGDKGRGLRMQLDTVFVAEACLQGAGADTARTDEPSAKDDSGESADLPVWLSWIELEVTHLVVENWMRGEISAQFTDDGLQLSSALYPQTNLLTATQSLPNLLSEAWPVNLDFHWSPDEESVSLVMGLADQWGVQVSGRAVKQADEQLSYQLSGALDWYPSPKTHVPFSVVADLNQQRLQIHQATLANTPSPLVIDSELAVSWPHYDLNLQVMTDLSADLSATQPVVVTLTSAGDLQQGLAKDQLTGRSVTPLSGEIRAQYQQLKLSNEQTILNAPAITAELTAPWTLTLAPLLLDALPRVTAKQYDVSDSVDPVGEVTAEQPLLSADFSGPLQVNSEQAQFRLAGQIEHPSLKTNQQQLDGTLTFADSAMLGQWQSSGVLADNPLSYQLSTQLSGDSEQLVFIVDQGQAQWHGVITGEAPETVTISVQPDSRGVFDIEKKSLLAGVNLAIAHPYGADELQPASVNIALESLLLKDSVAGVASWASPLMYRQDALSVVGRSTAEIRLDGRLSAPELMLHRFDLYADIYTREAMTAAETAVRKTAMPKTAIPETTVPKTTGSPSNPFVLKQLHSQLSAPFALLPQADKAWLQLDTSASSAQWGLASLPLPQLSMRLKPYDLNQPIELVADYSARPAADALQQAFKESDSPKALPQTLAGQLSLTQRSARVSINALDITPFAPLIDPVLTLRGGVFSGEFKANNILPAVAASDPSARSIKQAPAVAGTFAVVGVSGDYTGMLFDQVDVTATDVSATLGDALIIDAQGQMAAEGLYTGVSVQQVNTAWAFKQVADKQEAHLSDLNANLLGGHVTAPLLSYPSQQYQAVSVSGLDLQQAGALQSDPVVALNGKLDAMLPLQLSEAGVSMQHGRLVNRGLVDIVVTDPTVIDQYAAANPALALVLNNLKQMQVNLLSADMSMQADGLADIKAVVHGRNPNETRPVHLNYSHQENLYELLKSLRMGDSFRQQIEQQLSN